MTSSLVKILSLIDIPKFSDDIRFMILDYIYPRRVTKLNLDGIVYLVRLGPVLERDKIYLQITAYYNDAEHVLSSFDTYCDKKAMNEYKTLLRNISYIAPFNWEPAFMTSLQPNSDFAFYSVYVFCLDDESTVMFQITQKSRVLKGEHMYQLYFYRLEKDEKDLFADPSTTIHHWTSRPYVRRHFNFDVIKKDLIDCYQLALKYGSNWNEHYKKSLIPSFEFIIRETFWGKNSRYSSHIIKKTT